MQLEAKLLQLPLSYDALAIFPSCKLDKSLGITPNRNGKGTDVPRSHQAKYHIISNPLWTDHHRKIAELLRWTRLIISIRCRAILREAYAVALMIASSLIPFEARQIRLLRSSSRYHGQLRSLSGK